VSTSLEDSGRLEDLEEETIVDSEPCVDPDTLCGLLVDEVEIGSGR
jgi:hypothetical protein